MQTNLIFLGGPHGSGKTTLGDEIAKINTDVMIPELYSRNVKFNIQDSEYRQILKICSRVIENFEYLETAKRNPEKIILANRCIYDVLAYNEVYFKRGWISEETRDRYDGYAREFFREENAEPFAIVLNPGFEAVRKHLEKRWREKGKKWREEDLEYARLTCSAYEQFQDREGIFYINHEIDLESKVEIEECSEWIEEVSGITERVLAGV